MANNKLPTESIAFDRVTSQDIDDILAEIDDNENEKPQEHIFKHFWNNFKFGYGSYIIFSLYEALSDPSLGIDYDTQRKIRDELEKAAKDNNKENAEYDEWKIYVKTLNKPTKKAFIHRYNNLMQEKQLSIEKNAINQKALCCFQWRLPKYRTNDIKLLIFGFYRNVIKYIPFDVIKCIINYFGVFNDKNTIETLERWKEYKSSENYRSGIFEYESMKFCLKLQCNRESPWQLRLLFELICGPKKKFRKCEIKGFVFFVEKGYKTFFEYRIDFSDYSNQKGIISQIERNNIDSMIQFSSATFNLYFTEVTFRDINDNKTVNKAEEMKMMHPVIINGSILDDDNSFTYEWKLSQDEINKIKDCCSDPETKRQVILKSKIFRVNKNGFQCQIWIRVEADYTWEEDGGRCTSGGNTYFVINTFDYPVQIGFMSWYYSIIFNGKLEHCDDAAEGIGRSKYPSFESKIRLYTEKELLKPIRNNEDVVFKFCFNLLDIYDKHGMEINGDELLKIGSNKIISMNKLPSTSFKWNVSDKLLSKIKACKPTYHVFSKLFRLHSFVFVLELRPKMKEFWFGEIKLKFHVQLHLIKIPLHLNVSKITISNSFLTTETNTTRSNSETLNTDDISTEIWNDYGIECSMDTLKRAGKSLDSLTICNDIQILNVLSQNGENITEKINMVNGNVSDEEKELELKSHYFEWKISDKYYKSFVPGGTQISSEVFELFGCKWHITIVAKESSSCDDMQLYFYQTELGENIQTIAVHFKVIVKELDFAVFDTKRFSNDGKLDSNVAFGSSFIERKQVKDKESLTFGIEMTLFDICRIDKQKEMNNFDPKFNEIKEFNVDKLTQVNEYKWRISKLKDDRRDISPIYKMNDPNIEFQIQFYFKVRREENHKQSEVWVCINELPKHIQNIAVLCWIDIYVIGYEDQKEMNITICDIAHFSQDKLEAKLTKRYVKFEIVYALPLVFTIKTKTISMHQTNETIPRPIISKNKKITKQLNQPKFEPVNNNEIKIDALCCYQWRLPQYQRNDVQLLIHGYYKNQLKSYKIIEDIEDISLNIIELSTNYFGHYDIKNIFDQLKCMKKGNYITSGIFEYKSLIQFVLRLYPHGQLKDDDNENKQDAEHDVDNDKFQLVLELINKPDSEIYSCQLMFEVQLMELALSKTMYSQSMKKETIILDGIDILDNILDLQSFTFNLLFIGILAKDVYDEAKITEEAKENELLNLKPTILKQTMSLSATDFCEWNIPKNEVMKLKNASDNYNVMIGVIKSDTFIFHGMRCCIWMYPSGKYKKNEGKCYIIIYIIDLQLEYKMYMYCDFAINGKLLNIKEPTKRFGGSNFYAYGSSCITTMELANEASKNDSISIIFYGKILDDKFEVSNLKLDQKLISLPVKRYQWKVSNELLSKIKKSTSTSMFFGELFNLFSFTFMFVLHPKRLNTEDGKYYFLMSLFLLKTDKKIKYKRLSFHYCNSIVETNTTYSRIVRFGDDEITTGNWDDEMLLFDDIKKLESMTINCDIQILNVRNYSDGNDITSTVINFNSDDMKQDIGVFDTPKPHCFEWKVPSKYYLNDISPGTQLGTEVFDLFGFKWHIIFMPQKNKDEKDCQIRIIRQIMDPKLSVSLVYFRVVIEDLNIVEDVAIKMLKDVFEDGVVRTVKRDKLQSLKDGLTIRFEATLLDCFDKNEQSVVNEYNVCKFNQLQTVNCSSSNNFKWDIENLSKRENSEKFQFKQSGLELKFRVLCIPLDIDDDVSYFYLAIRDEIPDNIERICFMVTINIQSLNVVMNRVVHVTSENKIACVSGSAKLDMKFDEPLSLDINIQLVATLEKESKSE